MKRILINATQAEEVRVALVDGQRIYDLDIETSHNETKKSNVYKGVITRIEPSLEAAFVDYGSERHGFLPFKEVAQEYYSALPEGFSGKATITDVLQEGQELLVQVQKEERGNKGAALTTQITLAGPFVVMMPNNPKAGGISRRIEGADRSALKDTMKALDLQDAMGVIVRTAGVGRTAEELQWNINYLIQLWDAIQQSASSRSAPCLIHQESDIIIRSIRDYLRADIGEVLIDNQQTYEQALEFVQLIQPQQVNRIKRYEDEVPLFSRFQIESQIESAFSRTVTLPSGGELVIDTTEALTAVDINSSRATKGGDIEETALMTNLEAADEIARQIRLRDLGGLLVIDFIDMNANRNQREVENRLRDAVKHDRARVQLNRISRFGLLEMSRQRLRASLEEASQQTCPRCHGIGVIRGVESLSLSTLRLIEEEALKHNTARINAQVPVDVATYLLNEKRVDIRLLEKRHNIRIVVIPNEYLETPNFHIERLRHEDGDHDRGKSYETKMVIQDIPEITDQAQATAKQQPAVQAMQIATLPPAPTVADDNGFCLIDWIKKQWQSWFAPKKKKKSQKGKGRHNQRNQNPKHHKNKRGNGQNRSKRHGEHADNDRRQNKPQHNRRGDEQSRTKRDARDTSVAQNSTDSSTTTNDSVTSSGAKGRQNKRARNDRNDRNDRQTNGQKERRGQPSATTAEQVTTDKASTETATTTPPSKHIDTSGSSGEKRTRNPRRRPPQSGVVAETTHKPINTDQDTSLQKAVQAVAQVPEATYSSASTNDDTPTAMKRKSTKNPTDKPVATDEKPAKKATATTSAQNQGNDGHNPFEHGVEPEVKPRRKRRPRRGNAN